MLYDSEGKRNGNNGSGVIERAMGLFLIALRGVEE
jgi:hypothetical protein